MEKLISLVNQFIEETKTHSYGIVDYDEEMTGFNVLMDGKVEFLGEETILCKKYGFIKWLVEKELIKEEEIPVIDGSYYNQFDDEENILMSLAINDKPIELLINYLK